MEIVHFACARGCITYLQRHPRDPVRNLLFLIALRSAASSCEDPYRPDVYGTELSERSALTNDFSATRCSLNKCTSSSSTYSLLNILFPLIRT